jgi:hypothetical protein
VVLQLLFRGFSKHDSQLEAVVKAPPNFRRYQKKKEENSILKCVLVYFDLRCDEIQQGSTHGRSVVSFGFFIFFSNFHFFKQ